MYLYQCVYHIAKEHRTVASSMSRGNYIIYIVDCTMQLYERYWYLFYIFFFYFRCTCTYNTRAQTQLHYGYIDSHECLQHLFFNFLINFIMLCCLPVIYV